MRVRTVLQRLFGWEVRRWELAAATVLAVLGCLSTMLVGGGPVGLGFALLTGFSTALLLKGNVGAIRGADPDDWLTLVGLGYLLLGVFGLLNAGSIVALSLSNVSAAVVLTLVVAAGIGVVFCGRGLWFVSVSR
jgi:hypothetical protein